MLTKLQTRQFLMACTFTVTVSALVATSVRAGSPIYLGTASDGSLSLNDINHSQWNTILTKYVDANGMVDYRKLKANRVDLASLNQYLSHLSTANPKIASKRSAQLAFWINAYNAVTLHGILREYPTSSIRNHTAKLFGYNIWHDLQLRVGGTPYSLDAIEHKILRKMNEPRIHFAIVCASIGCPRLLNEAYTADRISPQLEMNAKDFFSRSQNFRYDVAGKRFQLSAILNWFGEDFGSNQAAQLRRISPWLPTSDAQNAAKQNSVSVDFLNYNWNLNGR